MRIVCSRRFLLGCIAAVGALLVSGAFTLAQTPSPALLILEKSDNTLAIVDPASLKILARVPVGQDPHEVVASSDGKLAYISNYGGLDSALNTISVVDLITQKPLAPINLGALHSAHGLAYAGGELYFTAETNKVIGRYDPASQKIDWVLGTGQDRTHMVEVSESLVHIFTSNVSSGTISIIEQESLANAGYGPPPGGARKTWHVTNVPSGPGPEGFDVSADGKEIWAANAQDGTVTVIDIASKRAIETFPISVKGANRLKFTRDGKRALVSGLGGGPGSNGGGPNLVVLDVATHKEIKQFELGGGSAGILITPDGSHAFVAVSAKDKVAVIDLKNLEVSGQIPTGKQPDGLAWAQRN
jgi:YVTN family beta-propeller protein